MAIDAFDAIITMRPFTGSAIAGGVAHNVVNAVESGTVISIDNTLEDAETRVVPAGKFEQILVGSKFYQPHWRHVNETLWFLLHGMTETIEEYKQFGVPEWHESKLGLNQTLAKITLNTLLRNNSEFSNSKMINPEDFQVAALYKELVKQAKSRGMFEKINKNLVSGYVAHTPLCFDGNTLEAISRMNPFEDRLLRTIRSHLYDVCFNESVVVQSARELRALEEVIPELLEEGSAQRTPSGLFISHVTNTPELGRIRRETVVSNQIIGIDHKQIEEIVRNPNERHVFESEHQYQGRNFLHMIEDDQQFGREVYLLMGRADPTKAGESAIEWFSAYAALEEAKGRHPYLIVLAESTRSGIRAYNHQLIKMQTAADVANENAYKLTGTHNIRYIEDSVPREILIQAFSGNGKRKPANAIGLSKMDGCLLIIPESISAAAYNGGNFNIVGAGAGIAIDLLENAVNDPTIYVADGFGQETVIDASNARDRFERERTNGNALKYLKQNDLANWMSTQVLQAREALLSKQAK